MTIKCKIRTEPQKRQALFPVKSYFSRGGKISSNKSPILKWLEKIYKCFKDVFEKVHKSIHFAMFRLGNVKNLEKPFFLKKKWDFCETHSVTFDTPYLHFLLWGGGLVNCYNFFSQKIAFLLTDTNQDYNAKLEEDISHFLRRLYQILIHTYYLCMLKASNWPPKVTC